MTPRDPMKVESVIAWGGWLTALLAVAVCLGIATLLGFGYRATREWQRSSDLLIVRDTEQSADLLVTAVTRDMRGAHSRVLANRDWGELSLESLTDTSDQVATAFARYPYPESFFSWQDSKPDAVVFFNRSSRFPAWMPPPAERHHYPVTLVVNPPGADALRRKVAEFSARRFRYATFDMDLGGQPYQIVARLVYADSLQERLHSVIGFTVNLGWVRESYFSDIMSQVEPLATRNGSLNIAVVDDAGQRVWGHDDARQPDHGARVPAAVSRPVGKHGRAGIESRRPHMDDPRQPLARFRLLSGQRRVPTKHCWPPARPP